MKNMRLSKQLLVVEKCSLKAEVQKVVEDIAKALGEGYTWCLGQISTLGVELAKHCFDDYVKDYAATAKDGAQPDNDVAR